MNDAYKCPRLSVDCTTVTLVLLLCYRIKETKRVQKKVVKKTTQRKRRKRTARKREKTAHTGKTGT